MSIPLVLICGNAGSGKDTASNILSKEFKVTSMAQADEIKRIVKLAFGVDDLDLWGPSDRRNRMIYPNWDSVYQQLDFYNKTCKDAILQSVVCSFKNYIKNNWETLGVKNIKLRTILQILGTEVGRNYYELVWTEKTLNDAIQVMSGNYTYLPKDGLIKQNNKEFPEMVIVSDGRFMSEIMTVKKAGGLVWKIIDPDNKVTSTHLSETELLRIPDFYFDSIIINHKQWGLEGLKQKLLSIVNRQIVPRVEI